MKYREFLKTRSNPSELLERGIQDELRYQVSQRYKEAAELIRSIYKMTSIEDYSRVAYRGASSKPLPEMTGDELIEESAQVHASFKSIKKDLDAIRDEQTRRANVPSV